MKLNKCEDEMKRSGGGYEIKRKPKSRREDMLLKGFNKRMRLLSAERRLTREVFNFTH